MLAQVERKTNGQSVLGELEENAQTHVGDNYHLSTPNYRAGHNI